ncbi:MAG: O-antigen ligase family protein [Bryobacteraceae bacterium]|nr:O-antigen ligase family protein [Bryobacteraceae bacterium]
MGSASRLTLSVAKPQPGALFITIALACAAALCATGLVILPTLVTKARLVYAGIGGILLMIAAYMSGNFRLTCLWSLMFTMPFDLNKHFGMEYNKMGGESGFKVEMSDPFIFALVLFLARDILNGWRPGIRIPKVTFLWAAIGLLGVYSILWGPFRTTAAHEVFRMVKVTVLFIVITNELNRKERLLQCAAALGVSMAFQSVVGLAEKFRGGLLGLSILGETSKATIDQLAVESVIGETVYRTAAFLRHPNLFGMFLAVLLPLMIGGFLLRNGGPRRFIFLAAMVLGPAALITTLSRSSWVSAAAAAGVTALVLLANERLRPRLVVPAVAAFMALVIIGAAYSGPIFRRLFASRAGASIARQELEHDAWLLAQEKPIFGWGMNSYAMNVQRVMKLAPRTSHKMWGTLFPVVHHTYLLWWSELGLVGLILHCLVWLWMIGIAVRNMVVKDEVMFILNAACLGGLVAFIPDGFFSFSIRMSAILRLYWIVAGMTMAIHYWRLQHEPPASARFPVRSLPEPVPALQATRE